MQWEGSAELEVQGLDWRDGILFCIAFNFPADPRHLAQCVLSFLGAAWKHKGWSWGGRSKVYGVTAPRG